MIKLERTSVMNLENAMRGARNPMNSWDRMDSFYDSIFKGHFDRICLLHRSLWCQNQKLLACLCDDDPGIQTCGFYRIIKPVCILLN